MCNAGTYTSVTGSTACSLCPESTALDDYGVDVTRHDDQSDCKTCPKMTVSMPSREDCIGCDAGA